MALASRNMFQTRLSARNAVPFVPCSTSRPLVVRRGLACRATETQQNITASSPSAIEYIADAEFSISKVSFGSILTPVGSALLVYGFGAYFGLLPGADFSSVMLVYGFPATVLGAALSYAQLDPAPCKTTKAAFDMREANQTDIQKQIREDCTRFRYGDEQHLEEALDRIFRFNRAGGIARKLSPTLTGLREEVIDGAYTLILEFQSKLDADKWESLQPKFQSFFGPGIIARVVMTATGTEVSLICDGSGAGRGGEAQKDPLPPLMPGLKGRRQD